MSSSTTSGADQPRRGQNETAILTDISTWPELAKYITAYTPGALSASQVNAVIRTYLVCQICQNRPLKLPYWICAIIMRTRRNSEKVTVLPCGHFFGVQCMKRWIRARERDGVIPNCPLCRHELIHHKCKHPIDLPRLHSLSDRDPNSVTDHIPYTRVHKLQLEDDGKLTFVDTSDWDPELADKDHHYGVPGNCFMCSSTANPLVDMDEEWN